MIMIVIYLPTFQVIATNKTDKMAKFLVMKSLEDVGVSVIKETLKDVMTAASNIMNAASYTAEYGKKNITLDDKQTVYWKCF